jgi:hypothetical protein
VYVRTCLVFTEMLMLSSRISDYPLISQGKTRIPGVNDTEEFDLTVVSRELRTERTVVTDIRQLVHFYSKLLTYTCPLLARVQKACRTGFLCHRYKSRTSTSTPVLTKMYLHNTNTYKYFCSISRKRVNENVIF